MPHPAMLVVDGTPDFLAKARVGFSVVKVELVEVEESKLMYGEPKFPRDVSPMEGGRVDFWGFSLFSSVGVRHGAVVKYLSEWARL